MSTTVEAATWPQVQATINPDGTATVSIAGNTVNLVASSVDEARPQVVGLIARRASQFGRPLRVLTRDPQGEWSLIVHGDGTVAIDKDTGSRPIPDGPARVEASPTVAEPVRSQSAERTQSPTPPQPARRTPDVPLVPSRRLRESAQSVPEVAGGSAYPGRSQVSEAAPPQTGAAVMGSGAPPPDWPSFITQEAAPEAARRGWRGVLNRAGLKMGPGAGEQAERRDIQAVSQHWPGPRTIAVVNSKGGAGKTPATILLAAVFARYGGAGVLAWDNNQTRGTLGWRTEKGPHDATLLDLLPRVEALVGPTAQAADMARYVHHQTRDQYDVLRSQPTVLAHKQRFSPADVDAVHGLACKYYRLVLMDSGNDESDPMWLRMIDHTDQLVLVTTTRDDHAQAGALLLRALSERDERGRVLAEQAVVVVSQADSRARPADAVAIASGYKDVSRQAVTIPFDPSMVDGLLHYESLRPATRRAWLAAAAAVATGL